MLEPRRFLALGKGPGVVTFVFLPMKFVPRFFLLGWLVAAALRADVSLAPLFTDHAVVQRDKALPVWGHASAGEHVQVSFHGQTVGTTTGVDGVWMVFLDALPASIEGADLVVTGKNTLTVRDILVGEVWLCSGQSN